MTAAKIKNGSDSMGEAIHRQFITPADAARLLSRNGHNRPINDHRITELIGILERGDWRFNGDAIRIATDGTLLDGQHRLLAAVRSSIGFETIIVSGLTIDAQKTIDKGQRRTASQDLTLAGVKNAVLLAAASRFVLNYMAGFHSLSSPRWSLPRTTTEIERLLFSPFGPRLSEWSGDAVKVAKEFHLAAGEMVGLAAMFSLVSRADTEQFLDRLHDGIGLPEGSPVLALRSRLNGFRGEIAPRMKTPLVIKAWNAYTGDRSIKTLKYLDTEAYPFIENLPWFDYGVGGLVGRETGEAWNERVAATAKTAGADLSH